jgi:hypothetical protein
VSSLPASERSQWIAPDIGDPGDPGEVMQRFGVLVTVRRRRVATNGGCYAGTLEPGRSDVVAATRTALLGLAGQDRPA